MTSGRRTVDERVPGNRTPRDVFAAAAARTIQTRFASILLLLVVLVAYFGTTADGFLTVNNLRALLTSASITWVVALGTTFVMTLGGFDLSVGAMLALSGVVFARLFVDVGLPSWIAIVATVSVAALIGGFVTGRLIGRHGVSFLVVTLGMQSAMLGLVSFVSATKTTQVHDGLIDALGFGVVLAVPVPVVIMGASLLAAHFVMNRTLFGRDVFAVGGNPQAARLSGIRVSQTTAVVYAISAGTAAFAGILQTARISAASPLVGQSALFDAVAAVLLGGTSFRGGVGTVTGTAVGVVFLATLSNGLGFLGIASFWQQIAIGAIVVLAGVAEKVQRNGLPFRRRKKG